MWICRRLAPPLHTMSGGRQALGWKWVRGCPKRGEGLALEGPSSGPEVGQTFEDKSVRKEEVLLPASRVTTTFHGSDL